MKLTHLIPTFFLFLFAGLRAQAQQQTYFTEILNFTNGSDGGFPRGGVISSGNILYGTAYIGGTNNSGIVFAVNYTNGAEFTVLHTFIGSDGARPNGGLTLSSNTLYGTTASGSTNGTGSVFAVNTDGSGFGVLHAFGGNANNNNDGANPYGSLLLSGNMLYGTTSYGGTNGSGTLFAVNTDGTGFIVLHTFSAITDNSNSDGANPNDGLLLSGNTLYGAAEYGGTNGDGTIFAVNTDGGGFTVLHTFGSGDGINPEAGLVLSGNTLYGTTPYGGTNGSGTVFAVNTDGTGFAVEHAFNTLAGLNFTNSDGATAQAGLTLSGNTLYGTAARGGTNALGTVFAVNTDGTAFTVLHTFTGTEGSTPVAGLILLGNTLYGTAENGGQEPYGTVFDLSPPPSIPLLNVVSFGNQVVVFYGLTGTNYNLQTTTNLASGTWVNVTNAVPLIAVGITNCAQAEFFRLH